MNIQTILDAHLAKEQNKPHLPSLKFTPSSMGSCFRRQIMKRADEEVTNPPDARTLRVFAIGKNIHEYLQSILPPGLDDSIEVEKGFEIEDVKGFADIVTKEMVIDIKTVHSRKFWHMGRKKDEGEEEAVERFKFQQVGNILQVMAYCLFLDRPIGKLVYVSRDDLCINEYQFKLEDWKVKLQEELFILRKFWEENRLPVAQPRLYPQKDGKFKECEYCQFATVCGKYGKEGINEWK